MTKIFNQRIGKPLRQKLRNNAPSAELILWANLKGKQLNGFKFRRQHSIGKFVVDFYCPEKKLVIEVDGDSHFAGKEIESYDRERQFFIESQGINFLRFTNTDVYNNLSEVLEKIVGATTPNPSLERRGEKKLYV